jgi:hypothetical protein
VNQPGVIDLEPLYAAFFALISGVNVPNWLDGAGNAQQFAIQSRVPHDISQLTPGQLPALFQEELPFEIKPAVATVPARTKYSLRIDVAIILPCTGSEEPAGQETNIPAQVMNWAITAVLNAVAPAAYGAKQNLGGLVDSVVAEGRIERVHGVPGAGSQVSIGVIPFTILTI